MSKFFKDFSSEGAGRAAVGIAKGLTGLVQPEKGNPGGEGHFAEDVEFASGVAKTVEHSLGREPVGYLIVSKSAACDAALVSKDSNSITVTPSATATVTLWIF